MSFQKFCLFRKTWRKKSERRGQTNKFSFPSCSSELINFTLTYSHKDEQRESISGERLTADGGPLRQDGDGSHRGVLQVLDGTVFGAPAVGADPQEMTHLVRSLTGVQDAPV